MSFNKITIVGNLGRDPELRYTPQGNAVCNFTMATNEKRRDKSGESQDVTTWFRITLWGKQAENASKYLTKGSNVYIEGRLRVEEWSDRDGKSRYTLDVHATDMQFIGARGGDEMSGGAGSASGGGYSQNDFGDDTHSGGTSGGGGGGTSMPTDDDIPF
jgi:single-strand DNA-binding protein